jgi:hypothetical protein
MRFITVFLMSLVAVPMLSQQHDCRQHRDGKFLLSDPQGGDWTIERKGKRQIEYSEFYKVKLRFRVKWLDETTYELRLRKVLENPEGHDFPKGLKLTATMSKCNAKGYVRKAVGHPSGATMNSQVKRLAD